MDYRPALRRDLYVTVKYFSCIVNKNNDMGMIYLAKLACI